MPTIWDKLRELIDEAEQCLRAEEQRYGELKAQYRELQAQHSELLEACKAALNKIAVIPDKRLLDAQDVLADAIAQAEGGGA